MKRAICIIFLFASVTCMRAQKIDAGIKAGLNIGYIDGRSGDDIYGLVNVHAGLTGSIGFGRVFGVQTELLVNSLSTTVYQEIYTPQPYLNPVKKTLAYISLPLLVNIRAGNICVFQLGPQYSFLLGGKKHLTNTNKDAFTNGNLAIVAGVQLDLGRTWQLYGRYCAGLSSTGHNSNAYYNNRSASSFMLQAGVDAPIFGKRKRQ